MLVVRFSFRLLTLRFPYFPPLPLPPPPLTFIPRKTSSPPWPILHFFLAPPKTRETAFQEKEAKDKHSSRSRIYFSISESDAAFLTHNRVLVGIKIQCFRCYKAKVDKCQHKYIIFLRRLLLRRDSYPQYRQKI